MNEPVLYDRVQAAARTIRDRSLADPPLRSFSAPASAVCQGNQAEAVIPTRKSRFPLSTVEAHAGRLILGSLSGKPSWPCRDGFIGTKGIPSSRSPFPFASCTPSAPRHSWCPTPVEECIRSGRRET